LGTFFGGLGSFTMANVAAIWSLGSALWWLTYSINQIPSEKIINFGASMDGLKPLLEATKQITPEGVELTKQVVEQAGIYAEGQIKMKQEESDTWFDRLFGGKKKGGTGTGATGGSGKTEVVLVLNDREFGRAVIDAVEKKHNLNID